MVTTNQISHVRRGIHRSTWGCWKSDMGPTWHRTAISVFGAKIRSGHTQIGRLFIIIKGMITQIGYDITLIVPNTWGLINLEDWLITKLDSPSSISIKHYQSSTIVNLFSDLVSTIIHWSSSSILFTVHSWASCIIIKHSWSFPFDWRSSSTENLVITINN